MLRTKIVSVQDFLKEKDLWGPAIRAEMDQLFTEKKQALRRTTMAELQELRGRGVEVELVPSKLVITLKPGPRRKVRIVACGNFIESRAGEELFAAGADASALRFTLKVAAEEKWKILTVDIKVAFLNAPVGYIHKRSRTGSRRGDLCPEAPELIDQAWICTIFGSLDS